MIRVRRSELLEKQIRRASENERVGSADGISSEEVYQYLTDGLWFLQRKIVLANTEAFRAPYEFSASGVEAYDLPPDILVLNATVTLEYSSSGQAEDYRRLQKVQTKERLTEQGCPARYLLQGSQILVNRYPLTGTFRLTYNRVLPRVDKRRATVSSHTKSTTALTALTLTGFTAADYALSDHLTVVDFDGNVRMRGIPYTAVNSGTGVVSIYNSSYTFPAGSMLSNGDYVCLGAYSSSHPLIELLAESFLVTYGTRRMLKRDSSVDAADIAEELEPMWADVVALYGATDEVEDAPVLQTDYFGDLL